MTLANDTLRYVPIRTQKSALVTITGSLVNPFFLTKNLHVEVNQADRKKYIFTPLF